jgi:hypothetical protein
MNYLRISFQHSIYVKKDIDYDYCPDDFIDKFFFDIYDDNDIKVGEGNITILDFIRFSNYPYKLNFDFSDIIDSDRQILNLFEVISTPKFIFNSDYDPDLYKSFFSKKFKNKFLYENVAYLDNLKIFKEYQSLNIGSTVLEKLKDMFFVDFIAVIPYPLEFNNIMKEDYDEKDFDLKIKKVINFYKKNGYEQIAKSEFYMLKL